MPKFIITVRAIANGAFSGSLGTTRYLSVPDDALPLPAHEITRTDWLNRVIATFPNVRAGVAEGNVVFFVHGFNETSDDVARMHGEIAAGLATAHYAPTMISFDWPSAGIPFAYLPDLDVAKRTAITLVNAGVRPLLAAQNRNCKVTVNVVCHSMGAYVLREALDHADDGIATGSDWMLGQLVMVAGDVEASSFVDGDKDTESMFGHAYRLSNYFNRADEVLQISNAKHAGVEPRVGRVGLPPNAPKKTVNLDCTGRYQNLEPPDRLDPIKVAEFSHSWYFGDARFYADLAQTLRGALDRSVVAGREPDAIESGTFDLIG